jgi:predicted ATP-grasp superfamily ATP-dependent carboligase
MKADESLIIVGSSARAAAFSALRAGLSPWCADLFGDEDLRQCCKVRTVAVAHYPQGLLDAFAAAPPAPWLYTGALENRPGLVRRLTALRPLWGNGATVLTRVRSPFAVHDWLAVRAVPCPEVRRGGARVPLRRNWLLKPRAGAGGRGIVPWTNGGARPADVRRWYFQEVVLGTPCAAVYVGDGRKARLLGVTRQLVGEPWLHAAPFHYCGSVGPLTLAPKVRAAFARLGTKLVAGFHLRGLFGVDCVLRNGTPWPVEVNPRYPASVEVLEYATGLWALALHRQIFEPNAAPPPDAPAVPGDVVGKAVMYAPTDFAFPIDGPWVDTLTRRRPVTELPAFADIPAPGQDTPAGWPVLTFFARADTEESCLQALQQIAKTLDRWLFRQ